MHRSTAVTSDSRIAFRTGSAFPVLTPDAARILLAILRSGDSAKGAVPSTHHIEEAS